MKKHILKVWMIIAISFLAMNVAGQVIAYSPAIGETDVAVSPTLSIQFDGAVTIGSGNIYIYNLDYTTYIQIPSRVGPPPNRSLNSLLSLDNNTNVLTIDLSGENLPFETVLWVTIDASTISVDGVAFNILDTWDPIYPEWTFTTVPVPTPLTATLNPLDNSIDVPIDQIFEISFSEAIQYNPSGTFYIELYEVGNAFSISNRRVINGVGESGLQINGNKLSIDFPVDMDYSTEHYITIQPSAIQSLSLENFIGIQDNEWSFTSIAEPVIIAPPAIVPSTRLPAPGAIEVSRAPTIQVQFDKQIQWGSEGFFRLRNKSTSQIVATISPNQSGATISADLLSIVFSAQSLDYGTEYYVEISNDFVRSVEGSVPFPGVTEADNWTFTTESAPPVWADGYPFISNQTMTDFVFNSWADLTGIYYGVVTQSSTAPTAQQISQGLNQGGSPARIVFNDVVDDSEIATALSVAFNSETPLGDTYYLHVVYSNGSKFSEVRTLTIDRVRPQILSVNPNNGSIVFPVDSPLSISFNEPVKGSDGNPLTIAYFSLIKNSDPVENIAVGFAVETVGEITSVTLTPTEPLDGDASYSLIINSVYDLNGNVSSEATINFETDGVFTWTGEINSDWTSAANWQGGSYVAGKSVVISGGSATFPIIEVGDLVSVNNLTVQPAAVLTQTGGVLNVTGEFHLQSSSERNASYIPLGGDLNVGNDKVFVHQVIPVPNDNWGFLMASPTLGADALNSGSGFQMRWYDNTTDTWNFNNLNKMLPGVGYSVSARNDLVFRGQINREAVQPAITRTQGQGFGWNVLGNPFTASLNWSDVANETDNPGVLTLIENNYWIWNPSQSIYNAFNQEAGVGLELDGTIPSNHGFIVKVKIGQTGGTINLKPNALVANVENYLKSTTTPRQYLKIKAGNEDFEDKLAVVFIDEATNGVDKFDTEKRFGNGKNPFEIYTLVADNRLTINSFPFVNNKEISLGFSAQKTGEYSLEISDIAFENVDVLLIDNEVGTITSLTASESYTFSVGTTGVNNSRFTLRFSGGVLTAVNPVMSDDHEHFSVFTKDRHIFVQSHNSLSGANFQVRDLAGRTVLNGSLVEEGINDLGTFRTGVYLVTIIGDPKITKTQKVVVY